MASVKMLAKFNKDVIKEIVGLGAKPNPDQSWHDSYSIQTKAGKLDVTLFREEKPSEVFSIFCRFDDPKLANEVLDATNKENLNTYSGKWNYHYRSGESCLEVFMMSLKEIL